MDQPGSYVTPQLGDLGAPGTYLIPFQAWRVDGFRLGQGRMSFTHATGCPGVRSGARVAHLMVLRGAQSPSWTVAPDAAVPGCQPCGLRSLLRR